MSQLERREALTERLVCKMSPAMKARVYEKAARKGLSVSDLARQALVAVIANPTDAPIEATT